MTRSYSAKEKQEFLQAAKEAIASGRKSCANCRAEIRKGVAGWYHLYRRDNPMHCFSKTTAEPEEVMK